MGKSELVGTAEAAAILGVTVKTVNLWAVEGKLVPAHKFPGQTGAYVYHRADIEAVRDARAAAAARPDGEPEPNGASAVA